MFLFVNNVVGVKPLVNTPLTKSRCDKLPQQPLNRRQGLALCSPTAAMLGLHNVN